MEQIIIEIRAAEGGQDSKLLVEDLRDMIKLTSLLIEVRLINNIHEVVERVVKM